MIACFVFFFPVIEDNIAATLQEDSKPITVISYIIHSFCQYAKTFCGAVRKRYKNKLALAEKLMWLADVITGVSNNSRYDKRSNKNVKLIN